ncbi:MAG: helix-turn-helix domain-containing protein [Nevskia sp.]|nr:helix-turn-helix domain-containing protein [Nevskia sp.]
MADVLTTDAVAPRQRVAYWQDMVCQTFVQARCDSRIGASFRGCICTESFGETEISRVDAGPQRILRRPIDIARASKPRFYLCYHAAGHARYRERNLENVLGPGDMILLDNCEAYSAEYEEPVTSVVLHVPHAVLRDRFRLPERVLGRKLDGSRGYPRIAGEFLQSCIAQGHLLSRTQRPAISAMLLNLFTTVLAEELGEQAEVGTHQAILLARAKQYVHAHLRDPGLSLENVAGAIGVSVRYVSRLFQRDGLSFGRYLLRQRIERCRLALANPALASVRIGEIALDNGFNNFAHFSRVFRETQGCSPSEYRARAFEPLRG